MEYFDLFTLRVKNHCAWRPCFRRYPPIFTYLCRALDYLLRAVEHRNCFVAFLDLLQFQDELSALFSRYAQTMLKNLIKGTASPGRNGSVVDSPERDYLSWLAPSGQLG